MKNRGDVSLLWTQRKALEGAHLKHADHEPLGEEGPANMANVECIAPVDT